MQEATQGLTSITHVFRANFFFWAVCLVCALFILLQRQGIEVKGCKAVKVMLINSEKIQNSEGIHQIRSLWLPIQCHCALIRLPSYRVQTSERSSTIAKYFLLLQGFSSKKKLCWAFCSLPLPISLGRKDPKEIVPCLELNALRLCVMCKESKMKSPPNQRLFLQIRWLRVISEDKGIQGKM